MNALAPAGRVAALLVVVTLPFLAGLATRPSASAPAYPLPGTWSVTFHDHCYDYEVEQGGTVVQRVVDLTFHTGLSDLSAANEFALQAYQLQFDANGPFGAASDKVSVCASPSPLRADDEPWVTGHHPMPTTGEVR